MTCLYISEDEDIVDLRAMSTVGGVMYLDLLKLPPQAKKVGNWVIQDSKYSCFLLFSLGSPSLFCSHLQF